MTYNGNITSLNTSGSVVNTPTSTTTNRLTGAVSYDSAGNLISWNGNTYQYDRFNQMVRYTAGSEDWVYLYTADDERFWSYNATGGQSIWSLRDLDGKLFRRYDAHLGWTKARDYIYRGSQLLASNYPGEGDRHFSLDHLGTPRLVTAAGAAGGFYTLTPCRVLDTRDQAAPLAAGETRTIPMTGTCGIPTGAAAVSLNVTVVGPSAQGEMTAYPANVSRPNTSVISYRPGIVRANNAILKLGNGALAFYCNQPSGNAHLIIDVNGYFMESGPTVVAYHAYYPFGQELTSAAQDAEPRKFTGHERDSANPFSAADDLDYMHARHYGMVTGRFLSTDVAQGKATLPQSWNRYSYALGNPVRFVDRDGREIGDFSTPPAERGGPRTPSEALSDVLLVTGAGYLAVGGAAGGGALGAAALSLAVRYPSAYFLAFQLAYALTEAPPTRVTVPGPTNSAFGKVDFLLGLAEGNTKSPGRGGFFAGVLGFTKDTLAKALKSHLLDNLKSAALDGRKVTVVASLTGPNGTTATVKTVWQIMDDGTIQFITAVPGPKPK